ncbi:MAG: hypothetical protein WB816_16545 [Methylocystis sp.]
MRFSGRLLAIVLLTGVVAAPAVLAEELSLDPKALDASGAASKPKAKKPKQTAAPAANAAKPTGKPGGDRQFGELEGWSPGKAPPKEKKDEAPSEPSKGPIGVTPSGNMSVGLPF